MPESLLPFFKPRGVVLVGASASPEKLGYGVARNLAASAYSGNIQFVSQKAGTLLGRPVYADLAQVPEPVDLALLMVPAETTPGVLRACGKRGIRAVILLSSGFRETGSAGAALEQDCVAVAREYDMRLLGPNCIGTIDTHLPLDTTFLQPPMPAAGGIGFVSHSGAFCAAIIDWSRQQGFGFSQIVSLGNQADVTEVDMLPMVAQDESTRVVALYMEGVSDGARFVRVAHSVCRRKPVIALKVGRFDAGQKAAASHTGALAGSDAAFDAAFRKSGVFRANSAEQMFDWARALERCPLPQGNRIAVLTDAGGPGVIAADALEINGLRLAELDRATTRALASELPSAASVRNPVDMLASASPGQYASSLRFLLEDPNVDAAMVILPPPPMFSPESVADQIIPIIQGSAKPVVVALLGSHLIATAFQRFGLARVVTYPFPERAASALGILVQRSTWLSIPAVPETDAERPIPLVPVEADTSAAGLVAAYGIDTLPLRLARSADEAASMAPEVGFPMVLKIASPDLLHKSDAGGVALNIMSPSEARRGFDQIMRTIAESAPDARRIGVHMQRQAPQGQEVIVGAIRDPNFGPIMMFGSGGIQAEGLKDVVFGLAPLSRLEARELMGRTWAGRRLEGFRSIPSADKTSVEDALVRLSWLICDHDEIREIEINPLLVFRSGAAAVDVRIVRQTLFP
jgi:acetyl coenzyme A synthetase (ADP forming)-like protein